MISLKKYLDQAEACTKKAGEEDTEELLPTTLGAYRSSLRAMGNCSLNACPALGEELQQSLGRVEENLTVEATCKSVEAAEKNVQWQLQDWGRRAAEHSRQRTGEIKEILIVMARTAESVGERDQRCARQIHEVTSELQNIANLEDLTLIRSSLKRSAAELKSSIERMTAEGKTAVEKARAEIRDYQTKLEKAEQVASCDSLTGLRNRRCVEDLIERRIEARLPLCVAILDLDDFKKVNDDHGHLVGDQLLKQFARELKSACRSSDVVGRWGGDEFIILLDCSMTEGRAQIERLRDWVCGNYTIESKLGRLKLSAVASIGVAEHKVEESMTELIDRADSDMYQQKAAFRGNGENSVR
jgi:diguanylate cyclase (GGDEF)-like protein